jgi:hypothetical protein
MPYAAQHLHAPIAGPRLHIGAWLLRPANEINYFSRHSMTVPVWLHKCERSGCHHHNQKIATLHAGLQ